ncbi:MAG TPA: class I SAM-dependent methyltransferase [Pyrinomonadaceae bacterium]
MDEVFDDGSVRTGTLVCLGEGCTYPVVRGIPRFLSEEFYADSFGYEWRRWSRVQFESENAGRRMAGHTREMFEAMTDFASDELENRVVVEFGCGPGRFLEIVRDRGGVAVGIDMSMAVESAKENFFGDPDVLIVQGDILRPPFKGASFDAGFTIGVLHHTPDPPAGLYQLARVVKAGGRVACHVYPKDDFYDYRSVAVYRRANRATRRLLGNKPALVYSYFSAYVLYHLLSVLKRTPRGRALAALLEKNVLVNMNQPDPAWRVLNVFDAITPAYASTHTSEEVHSWFEWANCRDISRRPCGKTTFVGVKGDEKSAPDARALTGSGVSDER